MLFEIPSDWCRVAMADVIASLEAGVSVNSEGRQCETGEIGVLKTSCVGGGSFNPAEHKAVLNGERGRVRVPVRADSIVLSRMNTPDLVGENAYVEEDQPGLFLPDRLWLLNTNRRADCRWLSFYMQSKFFRSQIDDIATGTSGSMKNISKARLAELSIFLPPLDEQRRIAEVLQSVDAAVASARTAEQQAQQTHRSLLEALFGSFAAGDPSHCDPVRLTEVCERVTYGFTNPMPTTDEGPWMVTALNVIRGEIDYETARHTSERAYNDLLTDKSRPTPGSILVTKDGTLGRVAVVDRPDICVNQSVAVLVPRQDRLIAEFLSFLLQSKTAQKRMLAESGGGSVKHIYITKLAAMEVGLPSLDAQKDLVAQAVQSLSVVKTAKSATRGLVDLRTTLFADLLSGHVRVPA